MEITKRNRPFIFAFYFILLSFALPIIAVVFCMFIQATGNKIIIFICDLVIYIANWPSFLLKVYPYLVVNGEVVWNAGRGVIHPGVISVNAIGWGLVGFIVGLIISAIKGRKQRRILTNKK